MKQTFRFILAILIIFSSFHCSSEYVVIQPSLSGEEKSIGRVQGTACGFLGFIVPWYTFFPMTQNSKLNRAYFDAVKQAPGAKGLKNIHIEEYWFWVVAGMVQCMTISGDAVR
ncbi:hypothetical protein [Leptospira yasudae]|uniref:Lipoprotein n=1 Tax=Leptospira yasudae TaxID=2202201 RepID=A0A6N4QGR5_9LEPT|nr:hypothetical protein [Leptospira yasudae]TGL78714.1 hypothetical protein EHQ72_09760 [Leptospira yasudae]TGL78963.1 hypothetical protein EHQ77_11245 [Leptospira yasudae]TGL82859.1 hypothetical protein EHQ83_13025 [Leptospira yasudae]